MKKLAMVTAIVALFGFATAGFAQSDDMPLSFGVKAGWLWFQDEPMSDLVENNWAVGADITFWFQENFGIGAEVQYLTKDDEGFDFLGDDVDFEFTSIPINANAYYRLPMEGMDDESHFYLGGGASFVFTDIMVDDGLTSVETDDTVIGFNVKAGFQYGLFFVEGQYLWAEWDDEDVKAFFGESDDLNVGGFSGWVGMRF